jgi:hypothetical protein
VYLAEGIVSDVVLVVLVVVVVPLARRLVQSRLRQRGLQRRL